MQETVNEHAIKEAKETKGIVALSFHWFSPIGGHDKSFYTKNTDFDAEKILKIDSPERTAFYKDMDVIAHELKIKRHYGEKNKCNNCNYIFFLILLFSKRGVNNADFKQIYNGNPYVCLYRYIFRSEDD